MKLGWITVLENGITVRTHVHHANQLHTLKSGVVQWLLVDLLLLHLHLGVRLSCVSHSRSPLCAEHGCNVVVLLVPTRVLLIAVKAPTRACVCRLGCVVKWTCGVLEVSKYVRVSAPTADGRRLCNSRIGSRLALAQTRGSPRPFFLGIFRLRGLLVTASHFARDPSQIGHRLAKGCSPHLVTGFSLA